MSRFSAELKIINQVLSAREQLPFTSFSICAIKYDLQTRATKPTAAIPSPGFSPGPFN